MPSVLFVCTGNTCRSPMAEVIFQAHLRQHHLREEMQVGAGLEPAPVLECFATDPAWRVESAGTWAQDGSPAARNAVELMNRRGLDLIRHHARTVNAEMLAQFQLILVMEANHKEALLIEFPALKNRIFMLSEMVGRNISVADPIAKDISAYETCANEMEAYIEQGWQRILTLTQS